MLGVVIFSIGLAVRFSWPNATLVFKPIYMIGLPLMLGGGLLAFWPKIGQVRQQDMQKSLRLAWYTGALAVPLIESGLVISAISATRVVGQYIVVTGIGVFIVLPWAVYALSIVVINEGLRTTAVLSLIPAAPSSRCRHSWRTSLRTVPILFLSLVHQWLESPATAQACSSWQFQCFCSSSLTLSVSG